MNIRMLATLALTLLAVSACVVEPMGGRGYYGHGDGDGGGHEFRHGGEDRGHDYGRGVWRG